MAMPVVPWSELEAAFAQRQELPGVRWTLHFPRKDLLIMFSCLGAHAHKHAYRRDGVCAPLSSHRSPSFRQECVY
jgi:hypothetical protein